MAGDREIKIRLTAKDEASKKIDDVADKVEPLEKNDHEVVVTGQDDATKVIADVETDAEELTKDDWTVVLQAKIADALGETKRLREELDSLEDGTYKATLTADVSAAERSLEKLEGKVRGTSGNVDRTIRNLGGPAGPMANVVGDWSESLGTVGEIAGTQLGLTEQAAGRLATVMGVGGALFGAALTFWGMYKSEAKKARERVEELIGVQEKLAQGETTAAIKTFLKDNKKNVDALTDAGLAAQDVWNLVTGQLSIAEAQQIAMDVGGTSVAELASVAAIGEDLHKAWGDAGLELETAQFLLFDISKAVGATTEELLDMAKNAVPLARKEILEYIASQNGIAPEKLTEIRMDANPDDVTQVKELLDAATESALALTRALNGLPRNIGINVALNVAGGEIFGPKIKEALVRETKVSGPLPRGVVQS